MERRPLVLIGGRTAELPSGDTVPGGAGSSNLLSGIPCDSDVYVGAAVFLDQLSASETPMSTWTYVSGVLTMVTLSYTPYAKLAKADAFTTCNVVGIVESKSSPTNCDILSLGVSSGIYFGLDVTLEYYLSDSEPGLLVPEAEKPIAPGNYLVKIGSPASPTQMILLRGERRVIL